MSNQQVYSLKTSALLTIALITKFSLIPTVLLLTYVSTPLILLLPTLPQRVISTYQKHKYQKALTNLSKLIHQSA